MKLTYAAPASPSAAGLWAARIYWGLAAVGFAVAAAGHVVLDRSFAHYPSWLPRVDEPELFWLLVPPFAVTAYTVMAVLTAKKRAWAPLWLAPAIVLALLVCGFIALITVDGGWATATAWVAYLKLLGAALVLSAVYVLLAFRGRTPNG
jgi:hypothetical protein